VGGSAHDAADDEPPLPSVTRMTVIATPAIRAQTIASAT
jgi:hypothetical protein